MTRINWGVSGERFYEGGVDRAVLYADGKPGVPWNGVVSVTEQPVGGAPTAYYIDGFKYATIAASENFGGTIQAYSSPEEFDVCDGTRQVYNGLFLTHQRRKPFDLCYRTGLGNDTNGLDHGYKLHLVYNALAQPPVKDNRSLSNSVEVDPISWAFSTTPPLIGGYRSTGHIILDSRLVDPVLMAHLEDLLYGSDVYSPGLPTFEELVSMFQSPYELDLTIINADTFTVSGWTVLTPTADTYTVDHPGVVDNGDGTFTITKE